MIAPRWVESPIMEALVRFRVSSPNHEMVSSANPCVSSGPATKRLHGIARGCGTAGWYLIEDIVALVGECRGFVSHLD